MGSLAGSNGGALTKPPKPQGQLRRAQAGVRQGRGPQLQEANQAGTWQLPRRGPAHTPRSGEG